MFEEIKECKKCPLWKTRTNVVVGEGDLKAKIMLIGEAPGRNEDIQGRPFVGKAGKFLDELLEMANLKRREIYITNLVKCRPPNNRDPTEEEIKACSPWLELQLSMIKPKLIITLGRYSMAYFQRKFGMREEPISRIHGRIFKIDNLFFHGYFIPMYHPASALYRGEMREMIVRDWERLREFIKEKLM